jgi:hypothetical protein
MGNDDDFEVIWHGAKRVEGTSTKGGLLGDYESIPVSSVSHSYLVASIRAKITKQKTKIGESSDGDN